MDNFFKLCAKFYQNTWQVYKFKRFRDIQSPCIYLSHVDTVVLEALSIKNSKVYINRIPSHDLFDFGNFILPYRISWCENNNTQSICHVCGERWDKITMTLNFETPLSSVNKIFVFEKKNNYYITENLLITVDSLFSLNKYSEGHFVFRG